MGISRLDYKRCGISCGNLWILQFPFGADHDSLRLVSYFNFFTRWSNNVLLIFGLFILAVWQFWPFRRQYLTILKVGYKASLESRLLKKPNCQKRTIVTKILCRPSSGQSVKDDVQCSTLEYLTDVGGVVFEGTGVEWMVGCVYSEAWNKHGKAAMSNHKPKTYTQTGGQFKTNIHIYLI